MALPAERAQRLAERVAPIGPPSRPPTNCPATESASVAISVALGWGKGEARGLTMRRRQPSLELDLDDAEALLRVDETVGTDQDGAVLGQSQAVEPKQGPPGSAALQRLAPA